MAWSRSIHWRSKSGETFGRAKVKAPWPCNMIVFEVAPLVALEFVEGLGEMGLEVAAMATLEHRDGLGELTFMNPL